MFREVGCLVVELMKDLMLELQMELVAACFWY